MLREMKAPDSRRLKMSQNKLTNWKHNGRKSRREGNLPYQLVLCPKKNTWFNLSGRRFTMQKSIFVNGVSQPLTGLTKV